MTEPPLIEPSDLTIDASSQVAYASAWIRSYCGWHIAPSQVDTITLDTSGGRLLMLPTLYLTALGDVELNADSSIIDPALLSWSQAGMIAYRLPSAPFANPPVPTCWPIALSSVTVTFTHGYTDVPDAIKGVAVSVAKRLPLQFANASTETAGLVTLEHGVGLAGGFAVSGFTLAEAAVLNRYRIIP